jgi:hypothetical protein
MPSVTITYKFKIVRVPCFLTVEDPIGYLHQEDVLVAVVLEHIVVQLDEGPLLILSVEVANVSCCDLVLRLYGPNQSGNGWRYLTNKKPFSRLGLQV